MSYFMGIMSGTSLDGVDIVLSDIQSSESFSFITARTYPIPIDLKLDLLSLSQKRQDNELDTYARLDTQMGHLLAQSCNELISEQGLKPADIKAIGSHGQTLRHYPEQENPTSLQIGDPNIIAQNTGITTIADFRRRDMAAGGQGAPLVPPFHRALFHSTEKNRVVLNIGGIANITFLPANNHQVLGYDTGPGNGLMDDWCLRHFDSPFDLSGKLAAQGQVHPALLSQMLDDPFFLLIAPKSTGREYFSWQWIKQQLIQLNNSINAHDVLRTLLELSCISISNEIRALPVKIDEVLVCGGGAHNPLLMQRLQALLGDSQVMSTEAYGLSPDWVEASAFSWLAYQTLNGLSGNLPSVTGASKEVILGGIWQA